MKARLLLPVFISLIITSNVCAILPQDKPVYLTEEQKAVARAAFNELKNLPKAERKKKVKQAKKEIKKFIAARKAGEESEIKTLLLVILAVLLPPLAVYLHQGQLNTKFWIALFLFLLGLAGVFFISWLLLLAAIIYALIVILGNA